jgi:hypothetical protein
VPLSATFIRTVISGWLAWNPRQPGRQTGRGDRFQRADGQRPSCLPGGQQHRRARLAVEPQQFLGDRLQRQSRRRQVQARLRAREQGSAKLGLEGLDLVADTRLREMNRLGRARDVAAARHREKGPEQSWMHRPADAPTATAASSKNCPDPRI